jgi:pectinesterase
MAAHRGNAAAVFTGLVFESPGEAEAFEDALLRQACFNVSFFLSAGGRREACVSRLDTARGGAGSGPVPVLRAALRDTLGEAVGAAGAVRGLASLSNHAREEVALRDCVELLGYSVDELGWALDAMADDDTDAAAGGGGGLELLDAPGRRAASSRAENDIHAWLSAALGNQDTCVAGFHGTDGRLLRRVEAAVAQLTQLVSNLLAMHKRLRSITPLRHGGPPKSNSASGTGDDELPPWVMDVEDEEELVAKRARRAGRTSSTRVDVVVAQDGSGRYRTVSEAVARAPSHSKRKYVIYVKRGEYHENVEVRKKKTNIVIVGEGMGETVISGSRSFSSGWTTFRSATFGNFMLCIPSYRSFGDQKIKCAVAELLLRFTMHINQFVRRGMQQDARVVVLLCTCMSNPCFACLQRCPAPASSRGT